MLPRTGVGEAGITGRRFRFPRGIGDDEASSPSSGCDSSHVRRRLPWAVTRQSEVPREVVYDQGGGSGTAGSNGASRTMLNFQEVSTPVLA